MSGTLEVFSCRVVLKDMDRFLEDVMNKILKIGIRFRYRYQSILLKFNDDLL